MKCPVDQTELLMSDRQGIEIDYCPKCRGVWLDRGELDKIIERSAAAAPEAPAEPQANYRDAPPRPYRDEPRSRDHYEGGYDDRRRYRKRKSFLDDLFDFD